MNLRDISYESVFGLNFSKNVFELILIDHNLYGEKINNIFHMYNSSKYCQRFDRLARLMAVITKFRLRTFLKIQVCPVKA